MPVIFRAETDVFREAPFVDVMVNPVNCVGTMGAGLAKEFSERHPDMIPAYKKLCFEGVMKPGFVQAWKSEGCRYTVVNLPTKVDYRDDSDVDYIRKGLMALRKWLQEKGHEKYTVTTPILGCGLGNLDQEEVKPLFEECLDDLPNIISVTQWPKAFTTLPKVLVIFGSRGFANPFTDKNKTPNQYYSDQLHYMNERIKEAIAGWGLEITDFVAAMSGGAIGTDMAACGKRYRDSSYYKSIMHKMCEGTSVKVVVAEADWDRDPKGAGFIRNRFMADVGTHFIGFIPRDVRSPGSLSIVSTLETINKKIGEKTNTPQRSRFYKYLKVYDDYGFGDNAVSL